MKMELHRKSRTVRGPTYREFANNDRHNFENLGVSRIWHIAIIVDQYSIKQSGYNVGANHLQIISFFYVCLDELENLLLNGAKSSNFWCLGRNISYTTLASYKGSFHQLIHLPSFATASEII